MKIGIRREDKNKWEGRVPLIPDHVKWLIKEKNIDVYIQPSEIRTYSDQEYREAGARVQEDLSKCDLVLGVKEMPIKFFQRGKTYMFFSHTLKGQDYNLPIIKKIEELEDNLLDYETITNGRGRRLLFFGRFAGLAGMMDSFWALKERYKYEGVKLNLDEFKPTLKYGSLEKARRFYHRLGENIKKDGLPEEITPLIVGICGYGNVSRGAQEIIDLLPHEDIKPEDLKDFVESGEHSAKKIYKVVFKEEDMVEKKSGDGEFILTDYYQNPAKYKSKFAQYLPFLTMLINAIYWDERYPRLVTKEELQELYSNTNPKLKVIGDISCDIEGAIEATVKNNNPGNPVYVYDVEQSQAIDGIAGTGPVILAVDNLPCELARESSAAFSKGLMKFLPQLLDCNFNDDFENLELPPELKKAMILYHGKLTPHYYYLENYL